jgi:beta-lysine 5,6-aminomutase alpha subunit
MMTEAIHTPFMSERAMSIENARYIFNNMRNIGDEIEFKEGGMIQSRAAFVLGKAEELLHEIETEGLFATLEQGKFGGVKRARTGGKGLDGVVQKDSKYFNPFIDLMLQNK